MELTALIGICCTIIGCIIGVFGFRRNQMTYQPEKEKEIKKNPIGFNR